MCQTHALSPLNMVTNFIIKTTYVVDVVNISSFTDKEIESHRGWTLWLEFHS